MNRSTFTGACAGIILAVVVGGGAVPAQAAVGAARPPADDSSVAMGDVLPEEDDSYAPPGDDNPSEGVDYTQRANAKATQAIMQITLTA